MKKKSPPYAIVGAALLGVICIFLFVQWKKAQDQAVQAAMDKAADLKAQLDAANAKPTVSVTPTATDMRNVLYATQPVAAGVKISPAFFEKKLTPNNILPDAFTDQGDIVGFYAIRQIEKGDPLTPKNVGKSLPYMTQRISPGMRAVALSVFNAQDNYTGGFVVDGDKVDLLFTSTAHDLKIKTEFVLQNVTVLYVPGPQIKTDKTDGINPAPSPGDPISVTFEVTPEEAEALIFMSELKEGDGGHFSMILRSRQDKSEVKVKPFDSETYGYEWQKVQKMADKSALRVQELAQKIDAEQKAQAALGNTNETIPTPPNP